MTRPHDHNDQPFPLTDEGAELLAIYRELDEVDRVLLWSALLTLLDQQGGRIPDEESATWDRE